MQILLFANGEPPSAATVEAWRSAETLVVAADGGTRHALALGWTPHHIIGDLDSLPEGLRDHLSAAGTHFHPHPPEKDETDLELALLWAVEQGAERIVILGMWGGRPDQAVANLLLLALPALRGREVIALAGGWTVRCLHGGERLRLCGQVGDRISLLPLGGDALGVRTTGLRYPLRGERLVFGRARGVSNVFIAGEVTITLEEGRLWVFQALGPSSTAEEVE